MTIDERIEQLVSADERLRDNIQKQQVTLDKLTIVVMDMSDSIKRLERISGVLLINDEELDRRLTELEHRQSRKPQ